MKAFGRAGIVLAALMVVTGLTLAGCGEKENPKTSPTSTGSRSTSSVTNDAQHEGTSADALKGRLGEDPLETDAEPPADTKALITPLAAAYTSDEKPTATAAAVATAAAPKPAKPGHPNPAAVRKTATAPKIDGKLDDACWKTAVIPGAWVDVYTGDVPKIQPKAFVCYDDKNLYVAFLNPEAKMKDLVTDCTERDGQAWTDDSNELFIDPTAGRRAYYQFIVNAKGVLYDGHDRDGAYDSKCVVKVDQGKAAWTVEMAIPLTDLGIKGAVAGQTWTANFCRNRQVTGEAEAHAWADTGESFHNPEAFGKLKID